MTVTTPATIAAPATIATLTTIAARMVGATLMAATVLGGWGPPGLGGAPALAQTACPPPSAPAETISEVPWAQQWWEPDRVWRLSEGQGVVVAVVDTGVDHTHPQLSQGQVLPGQDLASPGDTDGRVDCDAHGTAVASLIAAARLPDVGFTGLAAGARILPVRVVDRGADAADPERPPVAPEVFAEAIRWATDQGAQVISVSIVFYRDHPEIAEAVQDAVARGVVVVAAVGNLHDAQAATDLPPYPAAYPGVVGVGAIDQAGRRLPASYVGPHVDLVAPGADVTVAAAGGGHTRVSGTSFAAPFVSATAALLRAAEPELTAAEVVAQLLATADPGPGGRAESGHGVVNPYRALTERVVDGEPVAAVPPAAPSVDPAAEAHAAHRRATVRRATLITTVAFGLTALLAIGAGLWRRGQRRGWRPSPRPGPVVTTPSIVDPEQRFFTVPAPRPLARPGEGGEAPEGD